MRPITRWSTILPTAREAEPGKTSKYFAGSFNYAKSSVDWRKYSGDHRVGHRLAQIAHRICRFSGICYQDSDRPGLYRGGRRGRFYAVSCMAKHAEKRLDQYKYRVSS